MNKKIIFRHGALCEPYEEQANEQGYTFGKFSKTADDLGFGLNINYIHGVLTESQYHKALERLQKILLKHLKELKGVKK